MTNTVRDNADHGHDFYPLANHMTAKKFTKEENCDFSAILFHFN